MRILIDRSGGRNVGDGAMLEGAVRRLLALDPRIEAHVLSRPDLDPDLFRIPRVQPVDARVTSPAFVAPQPLRDLHRPRAHDAGRIRGSLYFNLLGALMMVSPGHIRLPRRRVSFQEFCSSYDALHIVGGANLTDVFPGELWRKSTLMRAFHRHHLPVVLTGQQVGPFRSRLTGHVAARSLRQAALVGLREPGQSPAECRRFGIADERAPVGGDDSFGLAGAPVESLLERNRLQPGRFLAVNARSAFYGYSAAQLERFGAFLREVAGRSRMPLAFVPISLGPGPDSDESAARELARRVEGLIVVADPRWSPALAKGVLGQAWGAVGASYHFCTFAFCAGVPAACLWSGRYYAQKAQGLSAFWQGALDFELDRHEPARLAIRICEQLESAALRAHLQARARGGAEAWNRMFQRQVAAALRISTTVSGPRSRPTDQTA